MQPQPLLPDQPLSVPRRALDVEDYLDILRRHRAWILGPAFVGLVAGVVTAYLWQDTFLSHGTIRVVPPPVSARLVQSNVTEQMTQRINATYQNIIRRDSLLNLIQTYNLYPEDRKRLPTEDVMDNMKRDVNVGGVQFMSRGSALQQGVNAFTVSYSYSDRRVAQKVCQELISRFINESTQSSSAKSLATTSFFQDQFEAAKRELDEVDQKITSFRLRNAGELPEQEQLMIGRITALEATIQSTNSQISRASQDRLQMETQLRVYRDQLAPPASAAPQERVLPPLPKDQRLLQAEAEVTRLEQQITALKETYKDTHPDVKKAESYLEIKKKQRDVYLKEYEAARAEAAKAPPPSAPTVVRDTRELQGNIARMQTALQAKDMEIEDLNQQLTQARAKLKALQGQMESSPASHQEYVQLMRDRELKSMRFEEMSHKMQDATLASDLENRKQGETLEVLEQANLPEEPYAPKRPLIISVGLVLGIALGVALAGGREIKDSSLKNLKDVRAYTKLTVLGSIPMLENDFVVRRRRRMSWLAWAATVLVGILLMAGSVIYYYTSKA